LRKACRWLMLLTFVVVNGIIVFWVWRSFKPLEPAAAAIQKTDDRRRAASEHWGRTDKLAYDLIAQWNRAAVVKLDSVQLSAAVESLPSSHCIDLPDGAVSIDSGALPRQVMQDLDAAVTGFLRATRIGTADALIEYMRTRSEIIDPKQRIGWEKGLRKKGVADPEKLSDEELYRAIIATFKLEPHWSGIVVESSCRQLWNGKNVPQKNLRFDTSTIDPNTPPAEQALYLLRLLKGTSTSRSSFVSTSGSLQESHKSDARVLLCDLQLVIELDEAFSRAKAPYLLRFWFNPAVDKWQLVELVGFSTDPNKLFLPHVGY
jgi:hypothetical protein